MMVSFAAQNLLSLIRSHLFIFVIISFTLGDWSKKILLRFMSENVLPMFSSRSLMVTCLIFTSLNHFEFIFVHGVRVCSNFIDLHAAVQLSQHHWLKRLFFLHFIFLPPMSKIDYRCVGLFLGSLLCSIDLYVYFCANTMLFWLP